MSEAPTESRLSQALARMTDRERRLVLITSAVVAVLVVAGGFLSVGSALASKEKRIRDRRAEVAQLEQLRVGYDEAVAKQKQAEGKIKSSGSTSLSSTVQKQAQEAGLQLSDLNERRIPVKDSDAQEVAVDVNFKELSMDKLTTLLEKIEGRRADGVIKVTKLKAKTRFDNAELLEASLTVSTWKATSPSAGTAAEGAKP